ANLQRQRFWSRCFGGTHLVVVPLAAQARGSQHQGFYFRARAMARRLGLVCWFPAAGCVGSPDFDDPKGAGGQGGAGAPISSNVASSSMGPAVTGSGGGTTTGNSTAVPSGGRDLLENPSFERGLAAWSSSGDLDAAYIESLHPYQGTQNLATRSSTTYRVTVQQELSLVPSVDHTLRGWVRS